MTQHTHLIIKPTDYGAYREILKQGNKIVGYLEAYPKDTAVDEEKGKYFYTFSKPSATDFVSYRCDTLEEARKQLMKGV